MSELTTDRVKEEFVYSHALPLNISRSSMSYSSPSNTYLGLLEVEMVLDQHPDAEAGGQDPVQEGGHCLLVLKEEKNIPS